MRRTALAAESLHLCLPKGESRFVNDLLTQSSDDQIRLISSGEMTPHMAACYLRDERIPLRNFGELLRDFYPHADLQERLTAAFQDASVSPASVSRRVQNWISGSFKPGSREDIFRLAFTLHLTEDQTSILLGFCSDYGIHYRNGRELIYAWFLRRGLSYQEAHDFFLTLPPLTADVPPAQVSSSITHELQKTFGLIQTTQKLRAAYITNLPVLGAFHLRAYRYFQRYLDHLIRPSPNWGRGEQDYSLETVMERYLSLHMPSGKNRANYSLTQKLIKRNWPNATALKNIRAQREDVPRKLLLLLYIITENVTDESYTELDEDYLTLEERLDDHWWIINAILLDCGMPPLDPRSAFDWLVLYALTASGDESMSERMEHVIDTLYADIPHTDLTDNA